MAISRRNMLKLGAGTIAATAIGGCASGTAPAVSNAAQSTGTKQLAKHQVVVIGGGFGGLTVAKELKKIDSNFDVLIIEKRDSFMSCPFSNTYLGKLKGIDLGTFVYDYDQAIEKNGYKMLQSEVLDINRDTKSVITAAGVVAYDVLIMAPGIEYNYENQFPSWTPEKIAHVRRVAPPALIAGREHLILERNLMDMEDGDVIVTVPAGKFRCPPAPFERACMIAAYMKKEDIQGKVIILNPGEKIAKGAAFKEAWSELYGDRIEHRSNCKVTDVDPDGKTVTYSETVDKGGIDEEVKVRTVNYEVLNLIATNKANPVIEMSGVETSKDAFGKVIMNGCSFQTKTDANVYAVGDVVGHGIPPSGQTANWSGKQCAQEVAHKLQGKPYTLPVKNATVTAGNVCYSMVGDNPEEGIMVTHDFSWNGTVIKGKGHVPKAPSGKFRSPQTAKATREWFRGIMGDLFA